MNMVSSETDCTPCTGHPLEKIIMRIIIISRVALIELLRVGQREEVLNSTPFEL